MGSGEPQAEPQAAGLPAPRRGPGGGLRREALSPEALVLQQQPVQVQGSCLGQTVFRHKEGKCKSCSFLDALSTFKSQSVAKCFTKTIFLLQQHTPPI